MDMSPGKRRSSGKRDFERRLAGLNCKRGIIFAISVSIVLVIYYFSGRRGTGTTILVYSNAYSGIHAAACRRNITYVYFKKCAESDGSSI